MRAPRAFCQGLGAMRLNTPTPRPGSRPSRRDFPAPAGCTRSAPGLRRAHGFRYRPRAKQSPDQVPSTEQIL